MTLKSREEEAEKYATGNHSVSFPDTYELKAHLAGQKVGEQRVLGILKEVRWPRS